MIIMAWSYLVNEVEEKVIFLSQHRKKKKLQKEIMVKVEVVKRSPRWVFLSSPTANGVAFSRQHFLPVLQNIYWNAKLLKQFILLFSKSPLSLRMRKLFWQLQCLFPWRERREHFWMHWTKFHWFLISWNTEKVILCQSCASDKYQTLIQTRW